jgi:ribose 5-phosphate isomerase A
MADLELQKKNAAIRAVDEVQSDMLVGLGTGTTAAYAVREIARKIAMENLRIVATTTSSATETLATSLNIPLRPFSEISAVDLDIDGADDIDPQFRAIKGGGGALFREKIVAASATRTIIIVDSSKSVDVLGRSRLPVETHPFALRFVEKRLSEYGAPVVLRTKSDGSPFLTDQNANIFDLSLGVIDNPEDLASQLQSLPGVLAHGLFLGLIDSVVVGQDDGTIVKTRDTS